MKFTKFFYPLFILAGFTLFTSCGSDDDGLGGVTPGEVPSPSLKDKEGNELRITRVGNYYFEYDNEGRLRAFGNSEYGEHYDIADDKFSIKYSINEGNVQVASLEINGTINSSGHLSAIAANMKAEYNEDEEYTKEQGSMLMKFNYNNNRLTGVEGDAVGKGEEAEYYDGELYKYSFSYDSSIDSKFNWENGNIATVNVKINDNGKEDGEKYTYNSESDYTISYGNTPNPTKQYSYYLSKSIFEEMGSEVLLLDAFAIVGLLGEGTDMLPVSYKAEGWERDQYEDYDWDESYSLQFTMNNNGTINTEKRNYYGTVTFQYGSDATNNAVKTRSIAEEIVRSMPKHFFRKNVRNNK